MKTLLACLGLVCAAIGMTHGASCDNLPIASCYNDGNIVCGTLTKTFNNFCALEAAKCQLAKEGFHFVASTEQGCCNFFMHKDYTPTCGSDGIVHDNRDSLKKKACDTKD